MDVAPPSKMEKVLEKDSALALNYSESTVDIAKSMTKKQRSRFIRSPNVAVHAGAPGAGSSSFLLAIFFTSFITAGCVSVAGCHEGFQFFFDNAGVLTGLNG